MLTPYQQMLLKDLRAPEGYGVPLIAWKDQQEIFKGPPVSGYWSPLSPDLAKTFIESVYCLIRTRRKLFVYRGYDTEELDAPFGKEHPGFIRSLVTMRRPDTPDGLWWTPTRPTMERDDADLAPVHCGEQRGGPAVKLKSNHLDYYIEGEVPIGTYIYVGRAAMQQESAAFGAQKYGGGGFQFRLTDLPENVLSWVRRYKAG